RAGSLPPDCHAHAGPRYQRALAAPGAAESALGFVPLTDDRYRRSRAGTSKDPVGPTGVAGRLQPQPAAGHGLAGHRRPGRVCPANRVVASYAGNSHLVGRTDTKIGCPHRTAPIGSASSRPLLMPTRESLSE